VFYGSIADVCSAVAAQTQLSPRVAGCSAKQFTIQWKI